MTKRRTSSEVQDYIRQRYEDTALVIYRDQHVNKQSELSRNKITARIQHAFEDIAEVREDDLHYKTQPGPAPNNEVQSKVCVII